MTSLKRSHEADPLASNISSKVYVRSTRSGKVQKIVREVYLRTDIPCSSRICKACLEGAPRNAAGEGEFDIQRPWLGSVADRRKCCPLSSRTSPRAPRPFLKGII